jgi:hypothetical protein
VPMMVLNADAIAESEDGANLLSLLLFCNLWMTWTRYLPDPFLCCHSQLR